MFSFLNKPYPADKSLAKGLRNAIGVSIFLIAFFFIFKPFGLNQVPFESRWKIILLYGLINFISVFFVLHILKYILPIFQKEEAWVIWKEILSFILLFILITFGCLIANSIYFNVPFVFVNFLFLFVCVLSFGSLPVGFSIVTKYTRRLKENLAEARKINEAISNSNTQISTEIPAEELIPFHSDNKNESLSLHPKQFLFAESSANYVTVHYLKEGIAKKEMLRTTMKKLISNVAEVTHIVRCHRSFIVNLNHIKHVEGDSRGYEINLNHTEHQVPVSRSYISIIKSFLKA